MATRKRKVIDDDTYSKNTIKRPRTFRNKHKHSSSDHLSEADEDQDGVTQLSSQRSNASGEFWQAETILAEYKGQYKIKWKGIDPGTGKPYEPTWEPKSCANKALIRDWNEKRRAIRKRKQFIQSSDPIAESHLEQRLENSSPGEDELDLSAHRTSVSPSEISLVLEQPLTPRLAPASAPQVVVQLPPPNNSFDRNEYAEFPYESSQPQALSQESKSYHDSQQLVTLVDHSSPQRIESSQLATQGQDLELVVPDSQSSIDSLSLLPIMTDDSQLNGTVHIESPMTPIQATMPQLDRILHEDGAMGGRSPSVIPAPPEVNPPVGNSRLIPDDSGVEDAKLESLTPQVPTSMDDDSPAPTEATNGAAMHLTALDAPELLANERMVSLGLAGRLKDDYYKALANHPDILARTRTSRYLTEDIKQDALGLIERLNNICTHPDLNDPTTQVSSDESGDAEFVSWAEQMSAKFAFVKEFLRQLRVLSQDAFICVITCRQGPIVGYLQRLLRFTQFLHVTKIGASNDNLQTYNPPVEPQVPASPSIILWALADAESATSLPPELEAHVVIALDSSYRACKPKIRSNWNPRPNPQQAPVIFPIVYASPEHIDLALPKAIIDESRVKATLQLAVQTRTQCGEIPGEEFTTAAWAEEVAHYIKEGARQWLLGQVRPLQLSSRGLRLVAASQDPNSTLTTGGSSQMQSLTPLMHSQPPGSRPETPNSMRKRVLENTTGTQGSPQKRARTNMSNGQGPDSSILALNSMPSVSTQTQFTRTHEGLVDAQVSLFELADNDQVQKLLVEIKKWERDFSNVFDKYDRIKATLNTAMNDVDSLDKRVEDLTRLLERERESGQKLREAHSRERELFEQAKKDLAEMAILDTDSAEDSASRIRDELAKEKIRSSSLSEELDKARNGRLKELEKQVVTQKTELEFLRSQYQDRDRDLTVARQENEDLVEGNRKQRAQIENARAITENGKLKDAAHAETVKVLKAQLDAALKQQQKKEKDRGRGMATRSGSVAPRSPRVGVSPAGSRVVSRQESPVRREGAVGRRGRQPAWIQ